MKQPLRIGFDLDGVLLYNPLRIIRQPISVFKRNILNIKGLKFYYPKTRIEKFIWRVLHLSSIFVAPGINEIQELVEKGYIEAYIMTARYGFLKNDTKKWYKKLGVGTHFKALYHNTDKQPHIFKEQMIKKLKLDIYIDDNYDIVKHTDKTTSADIFWVYNILDVLISYKNKCTGLPAFLSKIKEKLYKRCYSRKLLLVTEYFPPHWTGLAKGFYLLAKHLKKKGVGITILTVGFDKKQKAQDEFEGLKIIRVPYAFTISRTHYSPKIIGVFASIVKTYDGVVINSPNSNILFFTILAKLYGKKVSIFHQADIKLPKKTGNRLKHFIIECLFDIFTIPSFVLADHISSYTKDYATSSKTMHHFVYKFTPFIPNPKIKKTKTNPLLIKRLKSLKKKGVLIGFAGRFVEEKGFDILFKAIPYVLKKYPTAVFVFAGEHKISYEPFYEKIKPLVNKHKKNVVFLGLLHNGDLLEFYRSLDVFVLSSRKECFALTQLEAALEEVPIVVTNIPGARILVKNTGFGEVVKPKSPKSIARGIINVLQNKKRYLAKKASVKSFLAAYNTYHFPK